MRAPQPAKQRHGYTLIEVMVAGTLFVIGIIGVTYMQGASVRSNQDAYETMVATNLARNWIERIRRDALGWTTPGAPNPAVMFAGRPGNVATYFVPDAVPVNSMGLWPIDARESTGANYHGLEIGLRDRLNAALTGALNPPATTTADIYYCTFGMFRSAHLDKNNQLDQIRAEVTTFWTSKKSLEMFSAGQASYNWLAAVRASNTGCDAVTTFNPATYAWGRPGDPMRSVRLATIFTWTRP